MSAFLLLISSFILKNKLHRNTKQFATRYKYIFEVSVRQLRVSIHRRFYIKLKLRFMRWHTFFKRCSLLKLLLSLEDNRILSTLGYHLKTLTFDLGCCPLDNESSHSLSVRHNIKFIIRSYVGLDKSRRTLSTTLYSTHEYKNYDTLLK